jgi:hypothetical protein
MRGPIEKTCEHCGEPFQCQGYRCWCESVRITDSQMDWIEARYQDCLCPSCLGQVAQGAIGRQSDPA